MDAIVALLDRFGRLGGAIVAALGLALLGFCVYDWFLHGGFFVLVAGIGLILTAIGLVVVIFGNPASKKDFVERDARLPEELLREVKGRPFPYVLCTRKRAIVDLESGTAEEIEERTALHMTCNLGLHHVEITCEEDLELVLAGLEEP